MVRRSMGLTGQVATVDELLTGRENIRMIGGLYGIRRTRPGAAERPTARTVLDRRRRRPDGASPTPAACGARLDLAVSLIASPPVLFLDEPTTGLDPRSRSDLWDVLRGLVARGHHAAADHAVPRGGRPARRQHRRDRQGPHHRRGHAAAAQAAGGQRQPGGHGVPRRRPGRRAGAAGARPAPRCSSTRARDSSPRPPTAWPT